MEASPKIVSDDHELNEDGDDDDDETSIALIVDDHNQILFLFGS